MLADQVGLQANSPTLRPRRGTVIPSVPGSSALLVAAAPDLLVPAGVADPVDLSAAIRRPGLRARAPGGPSPPRPDVLTVRHPTVPVIARPRLRADQVMSINEVLIDA